MASPKAGMRLPETAGAILDLQKGVYWAYVWSKRGRG